MSEARAMREINIDTVIDTVFGHLCLCKKLTNGFSKIASIKPNDSGINTDLSINETKKKPISPIMIVVAFR